MFFFTYFFGDYFLTRGFCLKILVTFSEKRPKKSWFQVYVGEEEVPWEQWFDFFLHMNMGVIISFDSGYHRVINAEVRQPKSERGSYLSHFFSKDNLVTPNQSDRQAFNATLASTLSRSLRTMLTHTSSDRGRTAVPLITNASGISPFPIKMTVTVGGVEVG